MPTAADVMKMVTDNEVKFIDFRFTDTRGKEQHVSVPVKAFGNDKFEDGHAFDGSSIAGWKGIQASDMLLMPDPASARMDPFTDEPTLILTCDVIEPTDGKGYDRDPRSIAKRAEAYLKSTGLGDVCYFGPEPEFFIFDSVTWNVDMSGCSVQIVSEEAPWSSGEKFEGGNKGHRAPIKGGYFPVPPVDSLQDIRSAICLALEEQGVEVEVHHHEVAAAGQCEIGTKFAPLVTARRLAADPEVRGAQRRPLVRQDRDLHAQADRRRQRLRHARSSVGLEGRAESVRRQWLCGPVGVRALSTSAASSSMPRRSTPSPTRAPTPTSVWCPASRRRSISPIRRATARRPYASRTCPARRRAVSKCAFPIRLPIRISPSPP